MRKCTQCDQEMVEGFDIKVDGGLYGISISKDPGTFSKKIDKPKVAICPECGEVSFYIEDLSKIQ